MFKRTVQQRRIQHSPDSEGEEPAPKRQKLEPVEAEPMEQGRPYQAFVGKRGQPVPAGVDAVRKSG